MLRLSWVWVCFVLLSLGFGMDARADAVTLRFKPPSGTVAGYKVYAAFATSGAITSAAIDAGARPPDSTGVASYSLGNLDPTRAYSVEMTAYDSSGVESARSNRITVDARVASAGETLGPALWQNDFSAYAPGVHVPGFVDMSGDAATSSGTDLFKVGYFGGTNASYGTGVSAGAVSSRYTGATSSGWGSYEISGRLWSLTTTAQLGIAARSTGTNGTRYYALAQNASGSWSVSGRNERALTCARGPALGVIGAASRWYSFKLRTTLASGLARVRAKVWPSGGSEPSAWQADCWTTSTNTTDSGAFSLMRGGSGIVYFDDLAVKPVQGTLDPIPGP